MSAGTCLKIVMISFRHDWSVGITLKKFIHLFLSASFSEPYRYFQGM